MGLLNGQTIDQTDFINNAAANPTPALNSNKIPKLEADGKLNKGFVPPTFTAKTLMPLPNGDDGAVGNGSLAVNTVAKVGQIVVPFDIIVNSITLKAGTVTTAGTIDVSIYSEDGQTRLISVTSPSITTSSQLVIVTGIGAVLLPAGIYYVMINANLTASVQIICWQVGNSPFQVGSTNFPVGVTGKPILRGELTIAGSTPPSTFSPTALSDVTNSTALIRLDN